MHFDGPSLRCVICVFDCNDDNLEMKFLSANKNNNDPAMMMMIHV